MITRSRNAAVPGITKINYTVDLLERDVEERSHIKKELGLIKIEHSIVNCSVLELGCGLGQNLELFRDDNRVSGIEGLSTAVMQARGRGLNVVEGNLEGAIDIESDSVDWAICLDVLEHLSNPLNLMLEARRVLRPSGRMIINVPNHFNWVGRLKILFGHDLDVHRFFPQCHEWNNPHLRFFTYRGIRQMIETAGFELLEDRSSGVSSSFDHLPWVWLRRYLAQKSPALFAPGFFLVIGKAKGVLADFSEENDS